MIDLKEDSQKFPLYHAFIVLFIAVGFCGLPLDYLVKLFITDEKIVYYVAESFKRIVVFVVAVVLSIKYGFSSQYKNRISLLNFIAVIPAFLVAINNFPIIGSINKNIVYNYTTLSLVLFLTYCLSVALFEESVFRGIVFPLVLKKLKDKKYFVFWSIVVSSALFSASHLLNMFAGAGIVATIMQVGYSFLIGSMCAITLVKTKNIFTPILIHFIFDIGGIIVGKYGIATGNQWDTVTIIITAILSVIVIIYMVIMTLKFSKEDIESLYGYNVII